MLVSSSACAGFGKYGNHCGVGGNDKAPIDQLDAICAAHDKCCSVGGNLKLKVTTLCTNYCSQGLVHSSKKLSKEMGCTAVDAAKNPQGACATMTAAITYGGSNAAGAGVGQEIIKVGKAAGKTTKCITGLFKKKSCKKITKNNSIDAEVKKKMAGEQYNFDNWKEYSKPAHK